jgi:hypothetical protein
MAPESKSEFETAAAEVNESLLRELWEFVCHNKKWWLVPVIVVLLLIGVVFWLSTTAVVPFIYTIF